MIEAKLLNNPFPSPWELCVAFQFAGRAVRIREPIRHLSK